MLSTLHRIDSSCMEAQLKPNASYVWKSMLEAQDIIVKDLRWRLGKKRSIKILGDYGIPTRKNPQPIELAHQP